MSPNQVTDALSLLDQIGPLLDSSVDGNIVAWREIEMYAARLVSALPSGEIGELAHEVVAAVGDVIEAGQADAAQWRGELVETLEELRRELLEFTQSP